MSMVGVFGKLTSQGDFVTLDLSPTSVAALQSLGDAFMTEGRARRPSDFEAAYTQVAPIAFQWPMKRLFGLLAASADSVGRLYPLMLVAEDYPPQAQPFAAAGQSLTEAAKLLDQAAFERMPLDGLTAAMKEISFPETASEGIETETPLFKVAGRPADATEDHLLGRDMARAVFSSGDAR